MDPNMAIGVKGLSKSFGGRAVLLDVHLDIAAGESVALTGANGAGKTTLLRCLAFVIRPTAGEVRCFGRSPLGDPAVRRLLSMVGHESFLYPHLTLRENLVFTARMFDVPEPAARADHLLRSAGLQRHAHRFAADISRGMRQRMAVARAMVHEPRVLLLDEPFSGLDAEGADWLLALLLEMRRQGRTLCFTTHDDQKLRSLAGRTLHLRSGRLEELPRGGESNESRPAVRAA